PHAQPVESPPSLTTGPFVMAVNCAWPGSSMAPSNAINQKEDAFMAGEALRGGKISGVGGNWAAWDLADRRAGLKERRERRQNESMYRSRENRVGARCM